MSRSIQILVHSNDEPLATFARAVADGVHAPLQSSDEGFSVSSPDAYVMIDNDDGSDLPGVPSPLEHDKLIQLDQVTSIDALTSSADVVFQGLKAQQRYGLVMVFDSQREMARFTPHGEIAAMEKTIGTATLAPDGSIVMRLRAEGPGGMVGHGSLTIAPADHDYGSVLSHIGGLAPGETKLVAPFPAPDSK